MTQVDVIYTWYTCDVHVIYMWYTCDVHVIYSLLRWWSWRHLQSSSLRWWLKRLTKRHLHLLRWGCVVIDGVVWCSSYVHMYCMVMWWTHIYIRTVCTVHRAHNLNVWNMPTCMLTWQFTWMDKYVLYIHIPACTLCMHTCAVCIHMYIICTFALNSVVLYLYYTVLFL